MKKEIFIIHRSEIVRKGLEAMLRNHFKVEVTSLAGAEDLDSFSELRNCLVLVLAGPTDPGGMRHYDRLRRANRFHLVHIVNEEGGPTEISPGDHRLTLDAPGEEVRLLVNSLVNTGNDPQDSSLADNDLTTREKEVLNLVALGHSNKEIAEKLFISIHTVISHRKNITEKLGIKSISGLTVYAILNKIIDPGHINPDQLI